MKEGKPLRYCSASRRFELGDREEETVVENICKNLNFCMF